MDKSYKFKKSDYLYIAVILVSIAMLFSKKHYNYGIILLLLLTGLIVYFKFVYTYKNKKWENFISLVSKEISKSVLESLEDGEIPILLIDNSGNIVWYNRVGDNIFIKDRKEIHITELIGKEAYDNMIDSKDKYFDVLINDRRYNISKIPVKIDQDEFIGDFKALVFNDRTEIEKAELKMVSAMSIEIDNYDDLLKSIDSDKKPFLLAEIENKIYAYAHELKAIIRKYENSKYLFIVSDYYINDEIRKKFPIIEDIKDIHKGNTIEPTLSIGIGSKGDTPEENQDMARGAKELALGRGGDQVVIKTPEDLKFFGGNVKEIEKQSRVRSRVVANALKDLFIDSNSVYIMGHKNPDLDSFGASIGISTIARGLEKQNHIILGDINDNIKFMLDKFKGKSEYENLFITEDEAKEQIDRSSDVLVIVDVHAKSYVLNTDIIEIFDKVVIIDHHRRSTDQIKNVTLSYIENYASSASELVTELIQYSFDKPILKSIEAEALYVGISVDTKSFSVKTGVRTFDAAAFLKRQGVSTDSVREMFNYDIESYNKKAKIIENAVIKDNIAISKVYNSDNLLLSAQAADELSNFKNIKASFVLTEINGNISINGRSSKDINVQVILEELGGGGHMNMAGTTLYNTTMDDAYKMLYKTINKNIEGDI